MAGEKLAGRSDAGWLDEVVVERYLSGEKPGRALTLAERHEAARALHAEFVEKTATRLRINPDEVTTALLPILRRHERAQRAARRTTDNVRQLDPPLQQELPTAA